MIILERHVAIVLAGGKGSRMQSEIPKQYMKIMDKPVLYYSLKCLEESFVDEIILVVGEKQEDYCQKEIVDQYHLKKVKKIVMGGAERYHSVYAGLNAIEKADYVYIHDGARPVLTMDILERAKQEVRKSQACAVGMPVKDTIKIVDVQQVVIDTPERAKVWQVQTPQVFAFPLIKEAYDQVIQNQIANVTDDAMVVECTLQKKITLVEGSYKNIKITTPEDLDIATLYLSGAES